MVGKINIVYTFRFVDNLDNLSRILFKKECFGFIESAEFYIDKIYDFIETNVSTFPAKKTPIQLQYLGSNYIFYKANQHTTWYILFEKSKNNYLIAHIINNHSKEAKWL